MMEDELRRKSQFTLQYFSHGIVDGAIFGWSVLNISSSCSNAASTHFPITGFCARPVQAEHRTCGGERVEGLDVVIVAEQSQIQSFANPRPGNDPRDGPAARIVRPVRAARPAVIGGQNDDRRVDQVGAGLGCENQSDASIRLRRGGELLGRAPSPGVTHVIHRRQMDEHQVRRVLLDDLRRVIGDVRIIVGAALGDIFPVQRLPACQRR